MHEEEWLAVDFVDIIIDLQDVGVNLDGGAAGRGGRPATGRATGIPSVPHGRGTVFP